MSDVKLTVLMPARNAGKYIGAAIRSVLEQTCTGFELLIVNDGSTDDTVTVVRQFNDPRIRLLEQPPQGVAVALNYGLREAKGDYIARFDADDICLPGRLEKQMRFLDEHTEHILVGSDAEYIDESGGHLFDFQCIGHTHEEIMRKLYVYCPFIHSGVMYRKKPVLQAGGYSPHAHNFEDYLLWVQLTKYGQYYNLPERLLKVRFSPGSVTIDEKWRGRHFRQLKKEIISRGTITAEEGVELLSIIQRQDVRKIKEGAYYALIGKKFLVDNHQPAKARTQLAKAIGTNPSRIDNYALYILSFFPGSFITWLHRKTKNRNT